MIQKDRDSVINLMVEVYQQGNRVMCLQSGMTAVETEEKIEQSRPAVAYLLSMIYDKLDENDLLVID